MRVATVHNTGISKLGRGAELRHAFLLGMGRKNLFDLNRFPDSHHFGVFASL